MIIKKPKRKSENCESETPICNPNINFLFNYRWNWGDNNLCSLIWNKTKKKHDNKVTWTRFFSERESEKKCQSFLFYQNWYLKDQHRNTFNWLKRILNSHDIRTTLLCCSISYPGLFFFTQWLFHVVSQKMQYRCMSEQL